MRKLSHISLAFALATTGLAGVSMLLPTDAAHAQRKKKEEEPKGPTFDLSKEFRAAFAEAQKLLGAGDTAGAQAKLDEAFAIATMTDEKYLSGQLYVQLGVQLKDEAMQKKGLETVLTSGRASPEEVMRFTTFLGEKAFIAKDLPTARTYLKQAIEAGQNNSITYYQLAEAHISEAITKSGGKTVDAANAPMALQGLPYLMKAVEGQIATGGQYGANWAKRGFDITRILGGDVMAWAKLYTKADTTGRAWNDVVRAVQGQNRNFTGEQNLDAMRLLREVGAMSSDADYREYLEAANVARRPAEALAVIKEGQDKGVISASNVFFTEQSNQAKRVLDEYVATLPESVRDSRAGASPNVTLATADALLSSGKPVEAAEIAGIALTKGVEDADRARMVRGIALVEQGKLAEARADMAAVTGIRKPVAALWMLYIDQKTEQASAPPAAEPAPAPAS